MDIAVALRAFLRTVERGSVTAAARDLCVSQPAVTKHLRNLEKHVGARLLERSSRVVRPTPQSNEPVPAPPGLCAISKCVRSERRGPWDCC